MQCKILMENYPRNFYWKLPKTFLWKITQEIHLENYQKIYRKITQGNPIRSIKFLWKIILEILLKVTQEISLWKFTQEITLDIYPNLESK